MNLTENEMEIIHCGYGEFAREQSIEPVIWPFFDLFVIHQGMIEICIGRKTKYHLSPNEALLICPNTQFSGMSKSDNVVASVHHFALSPESEEEVVKFFCGLCKSALYIPLDSSLMGDIERSLSLNDSVLNEVFTSEIQKHFLYIILGQIIVKLNKELYHSKYKSAFGMLIDSYYSNPQQTLKVSEMAERLNLSVSHFRAEFYKQYGEPPQRYLLKVKMKVACQLLERTQQSIKVISNSLGYTELSDFYRNFKNIVNTTPALYRKHRKFLG
ncbi:helix-turn-helix transcriptional regulator [Shewanella sp. MBTL60-007]|uniref:helix-turn-helix transcriptional regulator n=1 Tax=Shewanella sp. MBTL60-007 TaxID=2815911 RepID=UPI001BBABA0A|nr:helix-turn-helix domain-containing protein [Shewanella sp. MBTL60-007]GIU32675.1 hypothetical protein TUM3792_45310 [Shewanella sp. MBTL60-007]